MSSLPFSAPRPRSLPTATPSVDVNQTLANWQVQLNQLVKNAAPQPTPQNFSITSARGGLSLSWSPVSGADGYEILRSLNGSFTDDLQVIPVKNSSQSSYFDSLGGNSTTAHYRIRSTSGTASNPQSQRGPESGVVNHTSIDASDTKSNSVTKFDTFTTDATRSLARKGNYGAIKVSSLGQAGGSRAGAGAKSAVSNTAPPAQASTSFSSIGTGSINNSVLTVASGASIVPDPNNPGVISATQLQGVQISTAPPANTNGLQFNATNNDLEWTATPQTIAAVTSNWLNSYSAATGLFTAAQPAASDLSNGVTGTGAVVLAASPTFSGVPLAPTAAPGTNTLQIATTAFVVAGFLPLSGGTLTAALTLPGAILTAAAPTVAAGQVGLGGTTATTATAGGGQATPGTVLGYIVANVAGTQVKIPYYSV